MTAADFRHRKSGQSVAHPAVEANGLVDIEFLFVDIHSFVFHLPIEGNDLEEFQFVVAAAFKPVLGVPRHHDAFVLAEFAQNLIARTVKTDAAFQYHPEPIHAGVRVQIVVAALFQNLNRAPDDVCLAQGND